MRILVADDHEVVRRGVRSLLEDQPGWSVAGEAQNGREAVEKAKELKPDVVLIDISMPELNGLEATRQILKAVPRTEVLILTRHDSEELAHEVLAAGARGYVLKSDAGRNLVAALDAVSQHKPFLTSTVSEMVLDGYLRNREEERAPRSLTPREREIVQLLAEGKSNKEVATTLNISVKTVETHRAKVMQKLNFRSITELIHYAVRNRIIQI
ncbi:MAG TPA: response regulator transcription factor [Bryobacterales bacterium]|jgi:DNA-binding NarL/FixJ family response regulator|nr:response regulator transcription factor [Bryobacterales bacterium]